MNLSGIFVNIYLWKAGHSVIDVAWYNMYYAMTIPIMCVAAGWIIKHKGAIISFRTGIIIEVFFYMLLLYLKADSIRYLCLIGCLKGTSAAFFAMGMHTMTYDFSKRDEYPLIFSYTSIFSNISALTAPLITGFVLMIISSQTGYNVIFSCSLILYVVSVIFTSKIQNNKQASSYKILEVFKKKNKARTLINTAYGLSSMKNITFSFLISLLLYIQTDSELSVGLFSSLAGISSIFIIYVVGRRINEGNRNRILPLCAFAVLLSVAGLIFKISIPSILFYIVLSSMFEPLIGIIQNIMCFEVIKSDPDCENLRVEYIIVREFPIAAGRIIGLLVFIVFKDVLNNLMLLKVVIFLLGSVFVWMWLIMRKVNSDRIGKSRTPNSTYL